MGVGSVPRLRPYSIRASAALRQSLGIRCESEKLVVLRSMSRVVGAPRPRRVPRAMASDGRASPWIGLVPQGALLAVLTLLSPPAAPASAKAPVTALTFNRDGHWLLAAGYGKVTVVPALEGEVRPRRQSAHRNAVFRWSEGEFVPSAAIDAEAGGVQRADGGTGLARFTDECRHEMPADALAPRLGDDTD